MHYCKLYASLKISYVSAITCRLLFRTIHFITTVLDDTLTTQTLHSKLYEWAKHTNKPTATNRLSQGGINRPRCRPREPLLTENMR